MIDWFIHWVIFGIAALDIILGPGYNTLILRRSQETFIVHVTRQFHTLPGLSHSWVTLPNSYPNICLCPKQGGSLYHFYGLQYNPAVARTRDPLHETRPQGQHIGIKESRPNLSKMWLFRRGGHSPGVKINTCLNLHCLVASQERLTSCQGGLIKGVPLGSYG